MLEQHSLVSAWCCCCWLGKTSLGSVFLLFGKITMAIKPSWNKSVLDCLEVKDCLEVRAFLCLTFPFDIYSTAWTCTRADWRFACTRRSSSEPQWDQFVGRLVWSPGTSEGMGGCSEGPRVRLPLYWNCSRSLWAATLPCFSPASQPHLLAGLHLVTPVSCGATWSMSSRRN